MREARMRIMHSGGSACLMRQLCDVVDKETHLIRGASIGAAASTLPNRLASGQQADLIVFAQDGLPAIRQYLRSDAQVHILATSLIGIGTTRAHIRSRPTDVPDLIALLRSVSSFAYSSSVSGTHLVERMKALDFPNNVVTKGRVSGNRPVGRMLLEGSAEIGFQQVSELLEIDGVTVLGTVPEPLQKRTHYMIAVLNGGSGAAPKFVQDLLAARTQSMLEKIGLWLSEDV